MTNFEEIKRMKTPEELGSFLCDSICNNISCQECPSKIEEKCRPVVGDRGFTAWLKEESEG